MNKEKQILKETVRLLTEKVVLLENEQKNLTTEEKQSDMYPYLLGQINTLNEIIVFLQQKRLELVDKKHLQNEEKILSSKEVGELIIKRKEVTKKKWEGKTIYDKEYKETFTYDHSRDWYALYHCPERFIDILEMKLIRLENTNQ
ncbi:hypothetical protein ACE193_15295 [Bernardetia sp. OM2101]|uniref:hypothetical protein n=1 Tax=Bernardetia sp. OM2101 TaxID=3344876 RepID=UPI0035CFAD79